MPGKNYSKLEAKINIGIMDINLINYSRKLGFLFHLTIIPSLFFFFVYCLKIIYLLNTKLKKKKKKKIIDFIFNSKRKNIVQIRNLINFF